MLKKNLLTFGLLSALSLATHSLKASDSNEIEELNPFSPDIESTLQLMDLEYESTTGVSSHLDSTLPPKKDDCYQRTCRVFIAIDKTRQQALIFLDGSMVYEWKVSTGIPGRETPKYNRHPDGRIYNRYTSSKFPGGDYKGLGNMPYAIFIKGGFAIHGTPQANWSKLGSKASHGCIRIHPENAKILNALVREHGVAQTWFTIHD